MMPNESPEPVSHYTGPQINRLDATTRAKLRSTQILTTLPQIISELVQNSLDAKAKHIDIGIDFDDWMCWVRDDGLGISKRDLEVFAMGDAGARYCTSKEYAPGSINAQSTYGFRGEALASAAQISCLEIASRSSKAHTTWSVITKGGRDLYKGEAVRWRRESPGTVVCVRDAFFNLPVRRLSHPSSAKAWELVRQEVEVYALISPSVSFTLEDLRKNQDRGAKDRGTRIPKTSSPLATFRHLYGRALTERVESISLANGQLRLEGFISLHGASSKVYQFLYINYHPITMCDLHRAIDVQFSSSSFGQNSLDDRDAENAAPSGSRRSPRKSERKPVYVLNILVPPGEVDNGVDPSKSIIELQNKTSVVSFLVNAVRDFLQKYEFISPESPSLTQTSGTPRKRRRVFAIEGADDAKPGSSSSQFPIIESFPSATSSGLLCEPNTRGTPALVDYSQDRGPRDYLSSAKHSFITKTHESGALSPPEMGYNIRRTIVTSPSSIATPVPAWLLSALEANNSYLPLELRIPSVSMSLTHDPPPAEHGGKTTAQHQHSCQSQSSQSRTWLSPNQNPMSNFFTKADLSLARVTGQVDQKFIACLIGRQSTRDHVSGELRSGAEKGHVVSETSTLVLIDQHAADERVRVEGFLKELCLGFLYNRDNGQDAVRGVKLRILAPPKPVLVTQHELQLLKESTAVREAFQNWGICFTSCSTPGSRTEISSADTDNNGYGQILVEAIPEVVGEKLLQEDQLQDLIKGFLAQLQTDLPSFSSISRVNPSREADQGEFLWLKALRWCPQPLLDLINSKACRGAIMFNDTLTIDQCESLVRRLSLTAYPFQCAHGRPSLVPLIELGASLGSLGPRRAAPCDWSKLEN